MKKRIKTRRLTNIYHSDDDDVGDGSNLLTSSLSLSLSVPLPLPKTSISSQNVLLGKYIYIVGLKQGLC